MNVNFSKVTPANTYARTHTHTCRAFSFTLTSNHFTVSGGVGGQTPTILFNIAIDIMAMYIVGSMTPHIFPLSFSDWVLAIKA